MPHSLRINALSAMDEVFGDYTAEVTPIEAAQFAATLAAPRGLVDLLKKIDRLIAPVDRGVGKAPVQHHRYRVGQIANRRAVYLSLKISNFPKDYRFGALSLALKKYAQEADAVYRIEEDDAEIEFFFWWI